MDDGTPANTQLFSNITTFQTYNVNETPIPANWGFDSVSCAVSSPNGGSDSTNTTAVSIAMEEGENWTCTYLNSPRTGTLTVIKLVINDNGGTAAAAHFMLHAKSGGNDVAGSPAAGSETGTVYTLNAGAYVVSEDAPPSGYAQVGITGECDANGNVTVVVGQNKTCTITNNDIAPKLHLLKVVVNDSGGTKTVADFTLTANGAGANDLSGASPVDSGDGLQADTWALSETGPAGYLASAWVCVGGTQSGANITVGIGGEAICTITNNDIAPKLHLRKVVVNDNGGTKTVADFTLTANGAGANDLSGTSPVDSGAGLQADTWALSETNVYGYAASAWVCVGGAQSGSSITVGVGGEATCTITNDDLPGTIVIKKVTKPVNTGSFGFTTTGVGYIGFTLVGGGQNSQAVSAGTYTVKEGTQLGWILTGIGGSPEPSTPYNCVVTGSGGSTGVGDLNTMSASIVVKNGDTVTCTFENTGAGVTRTQLLGHPHAAGRHRLVWGHGLWAHLPGRCGHQRHRQPEPVRQADRHPWQTNGRVLERHLQGLRRQEAVGA